MKTPLTYYGGKQLLLKDILLLIPDHAHYIEPFLGGGSVFWAKNSSKYETINDTNGILINFYEQVKNNFDELNKLIQSSLYAEDLHKKAKSIYKNPCEFEPVEQAWAVWLLTRMSMQGVLGNTFRVQKNCISIKDGSFNCSIPKTFQNKKDEFTKNLCKRLENAQILNRDALEAIKRLDTKHSFFYIDPPYIDCDQGHYKGYAKENYIELLNILQNIKGKFMLSSFPNKILPQYVEANKWHKKEITKVKRSTSHKGKTDNKIEVLAMNYNPHKGELF